ncbi:ankyrin repeat domain-containing protein [Burkholderia cenocepacia]|uniref:ankyrin repeat domain-containing protein n=1 Tax=Burkholderia cenocepacia TaxID=95486 RepID=UPI002237A5CB|nr:ankyrin repeat domain-containing protein [Burkholderia cenocepacia]MCW5156341.1 ankyrin repeat domain-containing protein [Burkholderia cenocepacia]
MKEQIKLLEDAVAELNELSENSQYTSAKTKLSHNPNTTRHAAEKMSVYRFSVECELQTYDDSALIEVGFSRAVFDDGREEVIYFFTPNWYKNPEEEYFNSLEEALEKFLHEAKTIFYRGWLLSTLHFNNSQLEDVKKICESGFINQNTMSGGLVKSAIHGRPFVDYFLSKGADVKFNDNEALQDACLFGNLDMVQYLVELGADPLDKECILVAAREGHIDIVEYLLSIGANEAVARTYANADVDQYFQAKDFAQKLSSSLREKTASTDRTKI